jgi:RNA polymerase sigma factor (sigma-70 family)
MAGNTLTPVLHYVRRAAGPAGGPTDKQLLDQFLARRDEAAFAELVRRHGRAVLAACRQVLADQADVEDAFQATFVVLFRKADSVRWRGSIGNWLFGVAHRLAVRARARARRRRQCEDRAAGRQAEFVVPPDLSWREAIAVLHEELDRLPDRYRLPLLLCYLQGLSRDETAAQLGWTAGAVKGRLETGRKQLRARLARRGVDLSAGLLAALTADATRAAVLTFDLVQSTARLAVTGPCPAAVAVLARPVLSTVPVSSAKVAGLALLAVVFAAGARLLAPAAAPPADPPAAPPPPAAPAPAAADAVTYQGRVLDADGKPVAGAKLFLLPNTRHPLPAAARAEADTGGRFRLSVAHTAFAPAFFTYHDKPWQNAVIAAKAPGYGVGWFDRLFNGAAGDIRLARDDRPVRGRVLDLDGQPVVGATVRVLGLLTPAAGDLSPWLATAKTDPHPENSRQRMFDGPTRLSRWLWADLDELFPPVTSGADGRFRLDGLGRERIAELRIEGPTIETRDVAVLTRPAETVWVKADRGGPTGQLRPYYGDTFEHVAAPSAPIVGTVRDTDSGRPLAGAVVESYSFAGTNHSGSTDLRAVADADGRYRLTGMPRGGGHVLRVSPPDGQPYLVCTEKVPASPGLDPITVDFRMKRGVWIEGKVTDRVTGQPVHCGVQYFALADNPHVKDVVGRLDRDNFQFNRGDDGSYRLVGLPGPGFVAVRDRAAASPYPKGGGADRLGVAIKDGFIAARPGSCPVLDYQGFAAVNPEPGAESVTCPVELEPGRSVTVTVLAPDGRPLAGATVHARKPAENYSWFPGALGTASSFTVVGVTPDRPARAQILHPERRLAGTLWVRGDEAQPPAVTLEPWATVTGRLLSPDGEPAADARLYFNPGSPRRDPTGIMADLDYGTHPENFSFRTGPDGRFRIEGLIPGLKYDLHYRIGARTDGRMTDGLKVKPGETRDLGDVRTAK